MEKAFWLDEWQSGRTGFHRAEPLPLLLKHWPQLGVPTHARVLVPLAGKSPDMLWLAQQGHGVLGVELSPRAVAQFLADNGLQALEHDTALGRHFVTGNIELVCGDVFDLDAAAVRGCSAVYDRAALVALPADMRRHYADLLGRILPAGCRMLLVTLDYDPTRMDGPPFAIDDAEVEALYGARWAIEQLERRDIIADEPRFAERGLDWMATAVYALERKEDQA